ncbi:putative glycosyltransferase [Aphelenchoides besseyi]|nr:putative glycosyltransferase [Aphelenchoides besseyi]
MSFYGFIRQISIVIITGLLWIEILALITTSYDYKRNHFRYGYRNYDELQLSNEHRLNRSRNYLSQTNFSAFKEHSSPSSLTIGIVASDRRDYFYLTQTLGHLVHELNSTAFPLIVCYTERDSNAEIDELRRNFQFTFLYSNRSFPSLPSGKSDARIQKEANDYWECLERTSKLVPSDFILLLEDDAVADTNAASQLLSIVQQLQNTNVVDYIKLYHPWSLRKIPSFIQITSACTFYALVIFYFNSKLGFKFKLMAVLFASIVLTVFGIKYHVELPSNLRLLMSRSAYLTMSESCCTPAVLYRTSSVDRMVSELKAVNTRLGYAKDTALDDSNFVSLSTERNIFVHIGYYSSVRGVLVSV